MALNLIDWTALLSKLSLKTLYNGLSPSSVPSYFLLLAEINSCFEIKTPPGITLILETKLSFLSS
jgi:hypothetical protein